MNLFQKRAALLKVAQVKAAMRHVMRTRMIKQAAGKPKKEQIDFTSYTPNPKENPDIPIGFPQVTPQEAKQLEAGSPSEGLRPPVDTSRMMQSLLPGVGPIVPGAGQDLFEHAMRSNINVPVGTHPSLGDDMGVSLSSDFRDPIRWEAGRGLMNVPTGLGTFDPVSTPSMLPNKEDLYDLDLEGPSPREIRHSVPTTEIDSLDPVTLEKTRKRVPDRLSLPGGRVPDFSSMIDESDFDIAHPGLARKSRAFTAPFLDAEALKTIRDAGWEDVRKKAVQEARKYYEANGIAPDQIPDSEYRMRVARIIDRMLKERNKLPATPPSPYLQPYFPMETGGKEPRISKAKKWDAGDYMTALGKGLYSSPKAYWDWTVGNSWAPWNWDWEN